MDEIYTCGVWTVVPGREDEFVAAWDEMAHWTKENIPGATWAALVQDTGRPNRFLTFGPWENADAIDAWRASDGFRERVGRIGPMLESFEPGTYRRRAGVGM